MIIGQRYVLKITSVPHWNGLVVVCDRKNGSDWYGTVVKSPAPAWQVGCCMWMSYSQFEWVLDKEGRFKELIKLYESTKR